jgi:hypothetical protein
MPDFMTVHRPGLGNAASYQVSSIPFVSSSLAVPASGSTTLSIGFPQVTKYITITNLTPATQMRLGFSDAGVKGSNYFLITGSATFTADLKVTNIFLMSNNATPLSASLLAGLTHISSAELVNNWSGSRGIG